VARKKKSGGGGSLVLALIGLGVVTTLPKGVLIVFGIITIVGVVLYVLARMSENVPDSTGKPSVSQVPPSTPKWTSPPKHNERTASAETMQRSVSTDSPIAVTVRVSNSSSGGVPYRIPDAPLGFGDAKWIPAGEPIMVAGITISGGLIYVGTSLPVAHNISDPCLVDPSKHVATRGDYRERQMDYWPSYSSIEPAARRAYLNWLADGRQDPNADIGFVFLYFYGLERRILVDSATDAAAKSDWPVIKDELVRLLATYGAHSRSFMGYAVSLIMWIAQADVGEKSYLNSMPDFQRDFELPFTVRLALGQAVMDKAPIPTQLAMAWAKQHPLTNLRTPAKRCKEEFDKLFALKYRLEFGEGMVVTKNRTKLKLTYRPASSGFQGKEQVAALGDIPDVSVLTAPIKKLQELVEGVTKELETYSRFVGKNPEAGKSLEGLLLLPAYLWPDGAQRTLQLVKERMGDGMVMMSFQELLNSLEARSALTKDKTLALARALESLKIGIEPDVLGGAKLPKADEKVVLFAIPAGEAASRSTPAYQAAVLTLQLASAVAVADGEFCAKELAYLHTQVESWTHLTPNHIRRLLAHLRLLHTTPALLPSLRAKLEPLDAAAKETIAVFMATVAQADGVVSPEEVKLLEKLYKALGVEPNRVFTDVHAVASGAHLTTSAATNAEKTGFKLDAARIAALQKDTAAVTALLSSIFKEEESSVLHATEIETEPDARPESLLGLDEAHSALARLLLTRAEWTREELGDAAADLDLMADGALEILNEAAFDMHDIPFAEGENPVTVNPELLEKLVA
jgi:uncharacterized tellurite resistance protein B-like protein